VRLVEDHGVVLRQHATAGGDVGEVEGMVRDHELRLTGARACGLGEAARVKRAAPAGAPVGPDGELGPQCVRGLERQLGAVAGLGLREPGLERLERGLVARVSKQHRAEALKLLAAEVVLAAFQDRDPHVATERSRGRGHLVREQLLLERLRRRRDDHSLSRLERRDQVREALAGACARLRDEVLARRERALDGRGEGGLLRPRLVPRQRGGQRSGRAESVSHGRRSYASERTFPRDALRNSSRLT
jgi:hypothetical protein